MKIFLNISNQDIQFVIDDQLFLENLFMEIRGKTISYASFKKKWTNKNEKKLIKDIEYLEHSSNILNDNYNNNIEENWKL